MGYGLAVTGSPFMIYALIGLGSLAVATVTKFIK